MHALLFATAQGVDEAVAQVVQVAQCQGVLNDPVILAAAGAVGVAAQRDDLLHGEFEIELVLLWQHGQQTGPVGTAPGLDRAPVQPDLAGAGMVLAGQSSQQGALAGAVAPDQRQYFTRVQAQIHVVQSGVAPAQPERNGVRFQCHVNRRRPRWIR